MTFFAESWTICMLFFTKLPKIRFLAVVRKKFPEQPSEIINFCIFYRVYISTSVPPDIEHRFDKPAQVTIFFCVSENFSEDFARNQDFKFISWNIIFLIMFPWPHLKTFLKPCRYHGAKIQESVPPKRKKFKNNNVIKRYFFPKVGQVACCFWQNYRRNVFLLLF